MRDVKVLRSRTRLLLENKKQNTFVSENNLWIYEDSLNHKEKMSGIHQKIEKTKVWILLIE